MPSRFRASGFVLVVALSVLALACLPCQTSSEVVPTPMRTVPVSTTEAENLISSLSQGLVPDSEGRFVLVITEEELTSYAALNMQESVVDPQIILADGQMQLYGTMLSPVQAPLTAVASVEVEAGKAHVVVESVSVDGFPIPGTFVEAFAQQIDDVITTLLAHEHLEISEVQIAAGEMIITGIAGS
jgi:nitrate reductase NapAB chaperone NapD